MWPLAGTTLVLGGLLPSALLWLSDAVPADASLWRAAALYSVIDSLFVLSSFLFLWIGVRYGSTRGVDKDHPQQPAPYPGAWVEADGRQAYPRGFPSYLAFAFVISVITPALVLLACLISSVDDTRELGAATLGPYLLVFVPQMVLETKLLNRSFMAPVLPVLFAYYRLWQFIRSLGLARGVSAGLGTAAGGQHWMVYYLLSLFAFWVFDTGCTMVWMPGMFEWQLQDAQLLSRLSKLREEHQQKLAKGQIAAAPAGEGIAGPSPALAAKARHRQRDAGTIGAKFGSGDYDSYLFGT